MRLLPVAHLVAAAAYAGFQLTIRFLAYPQMAGVPEGAFPAYESSHQRRVRLLVGPLFLALGATSVMLPWVGDASPGAELAAPVLFVALLAVTAFGAVPQHRALSRSFDAAAHDRLLRWDGVRVAIAIAQTAVAVSVALG